MLPLFLIRYGGLPCFKLANDMAQPRPLGVAAVAGVFILLGLGMLIGVLILVVEHLFYRYTLPILRHKPKGTIWKSRNIMFFSQVSFVLVSNDPGRGPGSARLGLTLCAHSSQYESAPPGGGRGGARAGHDV